MITASAVSSRVDRARPTQTKNQPHRRRMANHQANRNGVTTSASGWKLAQLIHWIGAYIRKATANVRPIHGRSKRSLAIRYMGSAPEPEHRTPGRRTGTPGRRRASRTARTVGDEVDVVAPEVQAADGHERLRRPRDTSQSPGRRCPGRTTTMPKLRWCWTPRRAEDDGEGDDAGERQPERRVDRLQAGDHAEPSRRAVGPGTVGVAARRRTVVGGTIRIVVDRSAVVGLVGPAASRRSATGRRRHRARASSDVRSATSPLIGADARTRSARRRGHRRRRAARRRAPTARR